MIFLLKKKTEFKSKNAFQIVYKTGRSVVDSMSVMYVLANDEKNIKIGLLSAKNGQCCCTQQGKAADARSFRHRRSELKDSIHIIWVARKKLIAADIYTYDRIFMRLAKRAGILK